mmetsp:Transcript_7420/g.16818  ORF Transcript_7420/g.16818 Transcript_7420/m.16818 type:complete len:422 (+) Transcript_7420:282-1547(+)
MLVLQRNALGWVLAFGLIVPSNSFSPRISKPPSVARTSSALASSAQDDADDENDAVIRSPMRFLGPYPTMPLRFPNLATSSQRERNITGISLDWVLDTAANVNTINAQVAQELNLEKVGEAPGGFGAAGGIAGGDTFVLGDCELDIPGMNNADKPKESDANDDDEDDAFTFMKGLTASALPVASPAAAGLLGLAFFYCFEGGVEFCWGNSKEGSSDLDGESQSNPPPSVTFYGSNKDLDLSGMAHVPFESLPVTMLPSVTICINGKEIPALFDTGSPITVLNARAAEEAGIATTIPLDDDKKSKADGGKGGWNPFGAIASNIQSAKEMANAQSRGDILTIAGTDGKPVRLVKSANPENVNIKTSTGQQELSSAQIYVGDLPGLAALGGIGGEAPPSAVLGMDLLSCRPRVVFRAQQNEIYL